MKNRTVSVCAGSGKPRRSDRGPIISTVLAPTDFSPLSLKALEYARILGTAFGARLHLLHINDIAVEAPTLAALLPPDQETSTKLLRRSESVADEVSPPTRGLRCHLRAGKAFHEICEAARELRADLIVTATHGHSGIKRILLGGTTEKIVQHSPCPVLVVREHQRDFVVSRRKRTPNRQQVRLDRILVPTDFSEESRRALSYALFLARHFGAELTLLNVIYPHYYTTSPEHSFPDHAAALDEMRCFARSEMDKFVQMTSFGEVAFQTRLGEGHPVVSILDVATEGNADLIVLSTHGRTGLGHVLVGSTAEQVVRYATCPVFVVPRAEKTAAEAASE